MSIVVWISVATNAEVDLQLWEGSFQLCGELVVRIPDSSVQSWIQRNNFERVRIDPCEPVDQVCAER